MKIIVENYFYIPNNDLSKSFLINSFLYFISFEFKRNVELYAKFTRYYINIS